MITYLNLTLISLFIQSDKSKSPFLSLPNSNQNPVISIQNSEFSKSFTSIIRSQHFNSHFLINLCSFSRIINSVLLFEADSTFDGAEFHDSQIFTNDTIVSITNCKFTVINLENENKSAIISFVPININNSLFHEIKGGNGSCINSNSSLLLKYTTFLNNYGQNGACFYINSNSIHDTIIQYSIFSQNKAKYSPLFYRKSLGDLIISKCNISNCEATDCVGAFESICIYFRMDLTLFEKCKAKVHYGGIILREPQKLTIEKCTFFEMEHHSTLSYTASAIFISNGKNSNQITESEFINCINDGSYAISYELCESITLYKCIFSCAITRSIFPHMTVSKIECKFDVEINSPTIFMPEKIGYGAKQDKIQDNNDIDNNIKMKLNKKRYNLMLRNILIRFTISFVFAFLIASIINYFHVQSKHAFRSKSRRERL